MIASPNHRLRTRRFARPSVRLFLLVWLLTPAMLLVDVAVAQFGQAAQFGRVMAPYYLRRDIRFFVEELQLDEGQSAILESLYYDYEDGHLAAQERMKQRFESIKDEAQELTASNASKEQLFEVVLRPFVEQAEDWNRQRFEFLENVQAILSDPQVSLWNGFLRSLRRDKELPTGTLMAESVNLLVVLRQADIPSGIRSSVDPLMQQYDLALDAALVAREQIDLRNQGPMMKSMADPGDEALVMIVERIDASAAVRDVNTTYAALIRDGLPVEHGDRFADLFRSTAFPSFARTTAATRIFEKALELETISEETRTAIADLFSAYRSELEPLVDQMIQIQLRSEPGVEKAKARQFVTRVNAPSPFDAQLNESRQRRNDLDRRYIKQLESMLLRTEFLSLPGASRFADRRDRTLEPNSTPEGSKRRPDPEQGRRGVGSAGKGG